MKNLLPYIVIIALFLLIFNRECTRPGSESTGSDTSFSVIMVPGDSIPYPVEIIKKVPVPVSFVPDTEWMYHDVDTAAILQAYFARNNYNDTLMDDTSAFINLHSYVEENKLVYDKLLFQNRRATKIVNTTIINQYTNVKTKWYIGGGVNLLPNSPGLSADLLIVTQKKVSFDGGYDFVNKIGTIKGFYKIQFRKK